MTGLVWLLQLGTSRWWSGGVSRTVTGFGASCKPGLEPGLFPAAVEDPLTRLTLRIRPADLGLFENDPGAVLAEVRWGYGSTALQGTPSFLDARFYGRLERFDVDAFAGVVEVELEHHLAFAYRAAALIWSDERQRAETAGDDGLSMLPALARGDVTGRWPRRA